VRSRFLIHETDMQNQKTFHPLSRTAIAVLALAALPAWAQQEPTLAAVTVTGNPLGAQDLTAPVLRLEREELLLRARPTLGETLDGTPGVSSTYFGPNASRPVIRGLDGDRIRILNNGGASQDVSSLSYDHAVTLEPLLVERIEVLRGPATLQYGGSAVGGVVNVIDSRIAREPLFDAGGGVSGKADVAGATGNHEQSGAVLLDAGTRRYTLHVDAMSRQTHDVAVPLDISCTRGGVTTTARRLCNSASQSWGGAVGGTLYFERGYLGAALSTQDANYGTVAEDEVSIAMRSTRLALEGEVRDFSGPLRSVQVQFSRSDYRHTEFDAGVPGTLFQNQGHELRLQARQARWGALDGVLGLQFEHNEFSADGTEAYAPYSRTRQGALFAHEELATGWGKLSAGARIEQVRVESLGHPTLLTFTPATRNYTPASQALGALWKVAPEWQLTGNLSWNERAPKDYELFANGAHVATNAFEIGNPDLDQERSRNVDVGLGFQRGAHRAQLQLFQHQFSNYISLELSNPSTLPPEYRYTQVQARFTGVEASGNVRLLERQGTTACGPRTAAPASPCRASRRCAWGPRCTGSRARWARVSGWTSSPPRTACPTASWLPAATRCGTRR
jgi:iron complex outermembrane receptor protein